MHRDIKPQNILICSDLSGVAKVKISDFGISKLLVCGKSTTIATNIMGTEGWLAPEILNEKLTVQFAMVLLFQKFLNNKYFQSTASDIFALGIVFYYVLSRGYSPIQVISEMLPTGNKYNFKRNLKNLLHLNKTSEILLVIDFKFLYFICFYPN